MSKPITDHELPRRDFIRRLGSASAAFALVSGAMLARRDSSGPPPSTASKHVTVPDFSLPSLGRRMSVVTGAARTKTITRALDALGGIDAFISRGDRVVLKVNAAFASPASLSATTHPDLVAELVKLCFSAGAASVTVTDNPINDPASCFSLTGIGKAAESGGARVVLPRPAYFQPTSVPGARLIRDWPLFSQPLLGATKLIGVAPVKDHHRSGASLSMKNWYGLLGGRRNVFHQDIHTIILELAQMVRPTLVILDGTTTMMSNGPTGGSLEDLRATNTMIASTDQVAADAFAATLLGKTANELRFIALASAAGLGTADYESLKPARDHVG